MIGGGDLQIPLLLVAMSTNGISHLFSISIFYFYFSIFQSPLLHHRTIPAKCKPERAQPDSFSFPRANPFPFFVKHSGLHFLTLNSSLPPLIDGLLWSPAGTPTFDTFV